MTDSKESGADIRNGGKTDKVVFVTAAEQRQPYSPNVAALSISLDDDDDVKGAILPNGEINFACPCMASLVSGPCGYEFRESFSCFHYSTAKPKGSDCIDKFREMSECMSKYPSLYGPGPDDDDDDDDGDDAVSSAMSAADDPNQQDDAIPLGHHRAEMVAQQQGRKKGS